MRKPAALIALALVSLGLICATAKKSPDKTSFDDYADRIVTGDALSEKLGGTVVTVRETVVVSVVEPEVPVTVIG